MGVHSKEDQPISKGAVSVGRADAFHQKRSLVEKAHTRSKEEKYICFLDLNLAWMPEEMEKVKRYWEYGLPLWEIVRLLSGRYELEVVLLLLDLAEKGKLKPREGGVLGFEIKVEGEGK